MLRPSSVIHVVLVAAVVSAAGSAAQALVNTIDATATASVEETIVTPEGTVVNTDSAFEDLDESSGQTSSQLPLDVEAQILSTDREGVDLVSGTAARTVFNDPRLSTTSDPDEFGIAVGALSLEENVSHLGRSNSTETREITFRRTEIGEPVLTALEARSWFFLDGVMVIWSDAGYDTLAGTSAVLTVTVKQKRPSRPGGSVAVPVLTAGISLTGLPGGDAQFLPTGALTVRDVDWWDLTDLMPELGALHIVVIPNIAVPYEYPAAVGETFVLEAEINAVIHDQPHAGAAILLGYPLEDIIALINDLADADFGDLLAPKLRAARALSPARPLPTGGGDTEVTVVERARLLPWMPSLCGAMGAESIMLLALFAVTVSLCSRRRR